MTQSELKYARSLLIQKYRKEHNAYLIEGNKIVKEFINTRANLLKIYATEDWISENQILLRKINKEIIFSSATIQLEKISNLKTTPEVIAVVQASEIAHHQPSDIKWTLVLDRIQDPGNMGTIIRTADWFGIEEIILLPGCVEIYNPKVVQATMGSILRIHFSTITSIEDIINNKAPIYAADLNGENIITSQHSFGKGYIIMGNESQGIHEDILEQSSIKKITIPSFGHAESLNVGVACGIICSHLIPE